MANRPYSGGLAPGVYSLVPSISDSLSEDLVNALALWTYAPKIIEDRQIATKPLWDEWSELDQAIKERRRKLENPDMQWTAEKQPERVLLQMEIARLGERARVVYERAGGEERKLDAAREKFGGFEEDLKKTAAVWFESMKEDGQGFEMKGLVDELFPDGSKAKHPSLVRDDETVKLHHTPRGQIMAEVAEHAAEQEGDGEVAEQLSAEQIMALAPSALQPFRVQAPGYSPPIMDWEQEDLRAQDYHSPRRPPSHDPKKSHAPPAATEDVESQALPSDPDAALPRVTDNVLRSTAQWYNSVVLLSEQRAKVVEICQQSQVLQQGIWDCQREVQQLYEDPPIQGYDHDLIQLQDRQERLEAEMQEKRAVYDEEIARLMRGAKRQVCRYLQGLMEGFARWALEAPLGISQDDIERLRSALFDADSEEPLDETAHGPPDHIEEDGNIEANYAGGALPFLGNIGDGFARHDSEQPTPYVPNSAQMVEQYRWDAQMTAQNTIFELEQWRANHTSHYMQHLMGMNPGFDNWDRKWSQEAFDVAHLQRSMHLSQKAVEAEQEMEVAIEMGNNEGLPPAVWQEENFRDQAGDGFTGSGVGGVGALGAMLMAGRAVPKVKIWLQGLSQQRVGSVDAHLGRDTEDDDAGLLPDVELGPWDSYSCAGDEKVRRQVGRVAGEMEDGAPRRLF